jgi:hypothetical protein
LNAQHKTHSNAWQSDVLLLLPAAVLLLLLLLLLLLCGAAAAAASRAPCQHVCMFIATAAA